MHPSQLPIPPGHVLPGAIGHNRGVVRSNYAFMPPEGVMKSRLPQWEGTVVRFLAAPALGAQFAQFVLEIAPGGGSARVICEAPQHFFYILEGEVELRIAAGPARLLTPGGFAYVPPGVRFTLRNPSGAGARVLGLKKRYETAEGIAVPGPIIGQQQEMALTNHTGLAGRGFKHLLPFGDLRFDFEMNLMFFEPGVCFPAVETHIMEHGLYMLEGQGLYLLGESWHEIWREDFIWMGPFCPQQFYPTGGVPSLYLLYKNMNRDVAL